MFAADEFPVPVIGHPAPALPTAERMPPPQPALPVRPAESAGEEINDVLGDVGAEPVLDIKS